MNKKGGTSGEPIKVDKTLDAIGLYCPVPILKTREEIEELSKGQTLEILADDPAAEEDIVRWARRTGNEVLLIEKKDGRLRILVRKG
ncbi:MAG: sulfurtransferase TusA family protein [Methanomassiliicoccales archaeon]|jgi:TusA-related sulfurtransferase